jgi:hypothetical protein
MKIKPWIRLTLSVATVTLLNSDRGKVEARRYTSKSKSRGYTGGFGNDLHWKWVAIFTAGIVGTILLGAFCIWLKDQDFEDDENDEQDSSITLPESSEPQETSSDQGLVEDDERAS